MTQHSTQASDARPTLSQFKSLKFRRLKLLNYIKLADLQILRGSKILKEPVGWLAKAPYLFKWAQLPFQECIISNSSSYPTKGILHNVS